MKIQIMTSETCHTEVEATQITPHFAVHDDWARGKRTFKIDHIPTGATISKRRFSSPEVAQALCSMFEEAFGDVLDVSVNGFLKNDMKQHGTYKKYLAYGCSVLLDEYDDPINFSKFSKAKKQAIKDLGTKHVSHA